MTDPIGTAQERELIERAIARAKIETSCGNRTDNPKNYVLLLEHMADALQSRIAEVGRLEALLAEAATELDCMAQAVIDAAAKAGLPTKYAGRKVTSETGGRIRAALSLQRRV